MTARPRRRRLDGWGFEGDGFPPSPRFISWLRERLGDGEAVPTFDAEKASFPDPAKLPDLGCEVAADPLDRLAHARGQGLPDLLRLRTGTVAALPDGVARPRDDGELAALIDAAAGADVRLIPWGGGTSVTGGVNVPREHGPVVSVDLERLSGLDHFDAVSGLATFGAGTRGPQLEDALGEHGFTLGHFPQSWELSTLGGWIVTRSAGQASMKVGRIEDLVAGLELVAPGGRLSLPALPASAAGPDLRQLVLGSEGRLGVVTRATVRVRPQPEERRVLAVLLPGWKAAVEAVRTLTQSGLPLEMLRLSDPPETEVAMAAGLGDSRFAPLVRTWLRWRGIRDGASLLLVGASGTTNEVDVVLEDVRTALRTSGGAWLGERPGRRWLADRFRHPYLRDGLLDRGYATDTFETAVSWSGVEGVYESVREALADVPLLCHLSHPYRDGTSLYFTFFYRCPTDPDAAVARWAELKRRATDALTRAGGTVSHHHGVGTWHAPWLARETGDDGVRLLRRLAEELDPRGILNPGVLLDPSDRLED